MTDSEFADRFTVVVDPDAEPVDVDAAVARFLLACVRNRDKTDRAPDSDRAYRGPDDRLSESAG